MVLSNLLDLSALDSMKTLAYLAYSYLNRTILCMSRKQNRAMMFFTLYPDEILLVGKNLEMI